MKPVAITALALAVGVLPVPAAAAPAPGQQPAPEAAPQQTTTDGPGGHPEGHGMVVAGTAITIGGVAAYIVLGAGLGIGNRADQDLASLTGRDDIERRRTLLARGRLGNRLAIAGGIAAAVTMAVGIPLIVVGRRRALADSRRRGQVSLGVRGAGLVLQLRL